MSAEGIGDVVAKDFWMCSEGFLDVARRNWRCCREGFLDVVRRIFGCRPKECEFKHKYINIFT